MANRYSVLVKFLVKPNSHVVFEFEGKMKLSQLPISVSKQEEKKFYNIFYFSRNIFDRCGKSSDRVEAGEVEAQQVEVDGPVSGFANQLHSPLALSTKKKLKPPGWRHDTQNNDTEHKKAYK